MRITLTCLLLFALPATAQDDLVTVGSLPSAPPEGLGDRRVIASYPTTVIAPDQAGPLDGADPASALSDAAGDRTLAAMMTLLAGRGCAISEDEVAPVFSAAGFTFEDVAQRLTALRIEGVAGLTADGRLTFPAALCPPDQPVGTPADRVVEAFRGADGCTLSEAAIQDALPDMDRDRLRALVAPLVDAGDVTVGSGTATLSDALCAASG